MNEYDSELLETLFLQKGYQKGESPEESDIIFVNTCAIREHAEQRALGRITHFNKIKQEKNQTKIIVGGCMAQRMQKELVDKYDFIDLVIGPDNYTYLPEILDNIGSVQTRLIADVHNEENYDSVFAAHSKTLTGFVAIMRGCNNFCTYCIVPYVRGRERSKSIEHIIKEVEDMVSDGAKEVTLIGQNVNSYLYKGNDFGDLLEEVNKINGLERVRFTTSHPKDMTDKIIDKIADLEKLCSHIHLPLQSGSNKILDKMNRKYTREKYLEIVRYAKKRIDNLSITTDLIVGFPGEREKDFFETVDLMERVSYDSSFMFKYSPRAGTKAADYKDQIDEDTKQRRLEYIIKLQHQLTAVENTAEVGKNQKVLVESVSKKNKNEFTGRTMNNKWVIIPGNEELIGKIINVEITSAKGFMLFGKQID